MLFRSQEWAIVSTLKKSFNVKSIDVNTDKIPDDIDVLMLVHPKNLSDVSLFAIDQYVLNGGRTIVFVDPNSEMDFSQHNPEDPMVAMNVQKNSDLKILFDKWGIELVEGKVVGDINAATRVTINFGTRTQSIDYVAWLTLKQANFNRNDFVTANLTQVNMATAGRIIAKEGTELEITPMIETSKEAMEFPQSNFQISPSPAALLTQYQKGDDKLILAVRISGKAKTAFPEGAPTNEPEEENKSDADSNTSNETDSDTDKHEDGVLTESKENINVIVVADTDMLADRFWVDMQNFLGQRMAVPRANNGVFVVNSVDNLSGSNDLISLRSRGKFSRPFTKVAAIQRDAEQKFREKEKVLQAKLKEAEDKLGELQRKNDGSNTLILSPAQQKEITLFREEQVKTRKELRSVQHELKKDIDSLGSFLKFVNIGLIPILIILFAAGFGIYKQRSNKTLA